jgi:hypothetical protein
VSASKTKYLRGANVALMSSATIRVEHAGGTCFSLECLYKLARTKEKEAPRIFDKEPLPDSLSIDTKAKETATTMSSITDLDGFTTVSHPGGSSTSSPPKLCPQSCSPTRQGNEGGSRRNPFDNKFLTTFLPILSRRITSKHAPTEIESDLKAYMNDPDSCQPSKKALCKDQSLLITAAQSSSSSTSPAQISMYTKKRTALLSPTKGGLSLTPKNPPKGDARAVLPMNKNTPSNTQKKVFDSALENQELEREAENTAWKMMMASFNQIVKEAEEEDANKEDAWLARIEVLQKKFADAAHQKGRYKSNNDPITNFLANNTNSNNNSGNDSGNDGIYGTMEDNEDNDFSYHSSDGSAEEEENDQQVMGQNAVGTSPLATNCNNRPEYSLLNWQYEINISNHMVKQNSVPPSLTKFSRASPATTTKTSVTPPLGSQCYCGRLVLIHGDYLTKILKS